MKTPGQQRRGAKYRKHEAELLFDAECRRYIVRSLAGGSGVASVARAIGLPRTMVEAYMQDSFDRLDQGDDELGEQFPEDQAWASTPKGPGPGPHVLGSPKAPLRGEVVDDPDQAYFRRRVFDLRKRALPFDEIAETLGRPVRECRDAVKRVLADLEADELHDAASARRLMIEQIDQMIAAIATPATGRNADGSPSPVVLEAIDRMGKLLAQKAKLLGLDAPQRVDITHRLEVMAEETGYEFEELRKIAQGVLRRYQGSLALR